MDKTVKLEWHKLANTRTRCLRITQASLLKLPLQQSPFPPITMRPGAVWGLLSWTVSCGGLCLAVLLLTECKPTLAWGHVASHHWPPQTILQSKSTRSQHNRDRSWLAVYIPDRCSIKTSKQPRGGLACLDQQQLQAVEHSPWVIWLAPDDWLSAD